MDNLEYLKKVKKAEEVWLIDDFVIRNLTPDKEWDKEAMDYRKVKALEIIAEELIKHNETSGHIIAALENLDTTLTSRK